MSGRTVARNAVFSGAHAVANGVLLFVLFRYLNVQLGVAGIGLWALVVASTAVGRIADFGIGGGVVRFVAVDLAAGDAGRAAQTVTMAVAGALLLIGAGALLVYPFAWHALALALAAPQELAAARALLPWALGTLCVSSAAGVLLAALDGCQRMDLRAGVSIVALAAQFAATFALVPHHGVTGVAAAQLAQGLVTLALGAVAVASCLRRPWRDWRWDGARLRELIRYGGPLQLSMLALMLFEPAAKGLLGAYGSLALVGHYEMASRLVVQYRAVLIAASQAIVPHFAGTVTGDGRARELYRRVYGVMFDVALPAFCLLALAAPAILTFWLGHYDRGLVGIALLLVAVWGLSTLSTPAYHLLVAIGRLTAPVASHVLMGVATVCLGWLLGRTFGGAGVVAAVVAALVLGSAVSPVALHRWLRLDWRELVPAPARARALLMTATVALYAVWDLGRGPRVAPLDLAASVGTGAAAAVVLLAAARSDSVRWLLLLGRSLVPGLSPR